MFTIATVVGIAAQAPSVTFGDSGEFSACAAILGLAHSPGYPLYALSARAFASAIGFGAWAYRTNLFSTFCGAASLAVLCASLSRLGFGAAARLGALAALGLSPLWLRETGVTEVFALNGLALSCLVWIAARFSGREWGSRPVAAFGLALGLGLGNHHTLLLGAPAFAWEALRARVRPARAARGLAWLAGFALLGLLIYLYLPIRSSRQPPLDWGHPTSWDAFWRVFARKDYGSFSLTVEGQAAASRLSQLARFLGHSLRELGPLPFALAALGALSWKGLAPAMSLRLPLALWALTGPFFFWLGNPPFDAQTSGALERFHLSSWIPITLLAAAGIQRLYNGSARTAWGVVALMAVIGVARWPMAARADYAAIDYGRSIQSSLPPSAILVMDGGDDTFYTQAYLAYAELRRPDLSLHDRGGLVFKSLYGTGFRRLTRDEKARRRVEAESLVAGGGMLFYSTLNESLLPGHRLIPWGLLRRCLPDAAPLPRESGLWELIPVRWDLDIRERHYRDRALAALYPFMRAVAESYAGRLEEALLELRRTRELGYDALWAQTAVPNSLALLGFRAVEAKRWAEAESVYRLWSSLDPGSAEPSLSLGVVLEKTGRLQEAESSYRRAAALDPASPRPHHNLGSLYWGAERWEDSAAAFEAALARKPGDPQLQKFLAGARSRRGRR